MVMMRWQATVKDGEGNVIDSPNFEVRREASGSPIARIYSDRNGNTPQANPGIGDANGHVFFHALGGAYRVRAWKGEFEDEWRYVPVGTYQEADQAALNEPGYLLEYDDTTSEEPPSGFFRTDNADLTLVTTIWVSTTSRGGFEIAQRLLSLDPGDQTKKNVAIFTGAGGGGASWEVDDASLDVPDNQVILTVSNHEGDSAFTEDLYGLQVQLAGPDGADSTVPGPEGGQGPIGIVWREDYSGATTYALNDVVTDPDSGAEEAAWISLQNGNLNHTPKDNPDWWDFFPGTFSVPADYGLITEAADFIDDYGSIA